MVGLPCSGKTTLAKRLETELGVLRLTPDEWHRELFGQDATHPDHDRRHATIEKLQWEIAACALRVGLSVILDFGFWQRIERDEYRKRAAALGARTAIHYLDVPLDALLNRLDLRNAQASEDITQIPLAMLSGWFALFQAPDGEELESGWTP
jgi:hypothetical protein